MTKIADKKAYEKWEKYREALKKATVVDISETFAEKQIRIKRLEEDNEAWFKYYFPNYCTADSADFQKKSTKLVMNNPEFFLNRCWARELAKTTRTRMDVLKLIVTSKKKNVILVSNSEDNAKRLLEPYRAQLDSNQRIINDYGKQRGFKWKEGDFKTRKGVAFRAVGVDQSPRGSNNDAIRPDVILIDDIDTDQDCLNPEIIEKRVNWIFDALIPTRSISVPLLIIACGNIIAEYCCMTEMNKKADRVEIINIRTNGKSSWSQKNSEEQIDRVLSILPESTIQKEYYNNPRTKERTFKKLIFGKVPPLSQMDQIIVYGDPSTSNRTEETVSKKTSFKVVMLLGRKGDFTYIIKAFCRQCSQDEFIQAYYDMHTFVTARKAIAKYWMECNSLQEGYFDTFYKPEFKKISKQRNITLHVEPDKRQKANKFTRVEGTLQVPNKEGNLIFNELEENNPDMKSSTGQFEKVSPTYSGAIDAPDCVEGGYKVLDKRGGMSLNNHRYQRRCSRRY
jgi:hypothetical protein